MKIAEQGNADAQFNLGSMYYYGRGVPQDYQQDYVQAHMWVNLAASQETGGDRQNGIKMRDFTEQLMTPEQIAEAQRLSREWKPKSSESQ